jgi:hypothetical protein
MAYTRPRRRGEAASSRLRHFHKICSTDRGAFRVHFGCEGVGTIVPGSVDAVERPYAIFDQRDQRVRGAAGFREALRAVSGRGRA